MALQVEYIKTDELVPYGNNAKLHPAEQIEQIKKSIEEFGFNDPIAVWKDNEIIEGHGRLIAAKELGIEKVPVVRLDDLTDEQRKAYGLAHNKLTMNSGFDFDLLNLELDDIVNIDMSDFGFDLTLPEAYDEDILSEYGGREQEYLKYRRVIIAYTNEQEEEMKEFLALGEDEPLNVTYELDDVIRRRNEL